MFETIFASFAAFTIGLFAFAKNPIKEFHWFDLHPWFMTVAMLSSLWAVRSMLPADTSNSADNKEKVGSHVHCWIRILNTENRRLPRELRNESKTTDFSNGLPCLRSPWGWLWSNTASSRRINIILHRGMVWSVSRPAS